MKLYILMWLVGAGAVLLVVLLSSPNPECVEPTVEPRKPQVEICAPFFTDGTGRWAKCMHVEPK